MFKIAICDDVEDVCSELKTMIIDMKDSLICGDIIIDTFYSGEALLENIEESPYDLIFLDIELGEINGVEVGHIIREQMEDYITKIIYISSKDMQQLRIIQADNAKMSLIRHDIKNHLFALKSLYEKGEIDSFKDYFNCILSNIDIEEKLCNSGNIIVDSMINYKLKGVVNTDISVDVCIPEKLDISDMDITVILGNLLDNALRAIKEVNERGEGSKLHLNLNYTKGRLILRIENSYLNVNLVRGNFLTTKKDKKGHGLGLESVKEVLSKYNGVLQINCDKGVFIVEAVLYCR